jgi:Raf kinase inhibitor-like YbhB/YbcL family protein
MEISSPLFGDKQPIPSKYTCDGENINPPLRIKDVPEEAKSLVLIMEDPDAPSGLFTHWLVWNLGPTTEIIAEGTLPPEAIEGETSFGEVGYGGPCPPDKQHRYIFRLYALDSTLDLAPGAKREELEAGIKMITIETAELTGLYAPVKEEEVI